MKIVIDIPRKTYNEIKEATMITCGETFAKKLIRYIRNGTPLPKHHGRLIDADYMIKQLLSLPKDEFSTEDAWAMKVLDLAPTIIEADKESDNDVKS